MLTPCFWGGWGKGHFSRSIPMRGEKHPPSWLTAKGRDLVSENWRMKRRPFLRRRKKLNRPLTPQQYMVGVSLSLYPSKILKKANNGGSLYAYQNNDSERSQVPRKRLRRLGQEPMHKASKDNIIVDHQETPKEKNNKEHTTSKEEEEEEEPEEPETESALNEEDQDSEFDEGSEESDTEKQDKVKKELIVSWNRKCSLSLTFPLSRPLCTWLIRQPPQQKQQRTTASQPPRKFPLHLTLVHG